MYYIHCWLYVNNTPGECNQQGGEEHFIFLSTSSKFGMFPAFDNFITKLLFIIIDYVSFMYITMQIVCVCVLVYLCKMHTDAFWIIIYN